jgi:hypothetical protein
VLYILIALVVALSVAVVLLLLRQRRAASRVGQSFSSSRQHPIGDGTWGHADNFTFSRVNSKRTEESVRNFQAIILPRDETEFELSQQQQVTSPPPPPGDSFRNEETV